MRLFDLRREVLALLPRYLVKDRVVAVGEVGYDAQTPDEDEAFAAQVGLAIEADLPVLALTPHRDKLTGTERSLDLCREAGLPPEDTLVDHLNELTVRVVAGAGCWMGFSIYPDTKMDEHRMERIIVDSAADWGCSDPLKVARTAQALRLAGFSSQDVEQVVWHNPVAFYSQSGHLEGSISTLPLGWRTHWDAAAAERAHRALAGTAEQLAALEAATGQRIRVGLEPEPGCAVETTEQGVHALAGLDTPRLGVCLDACHLAVQFEDPSAALGCLDAAGVPLVNAQHPATRHLEVETYTWSVLPPDRRPAGDAGLVEGLAAELDWARDQLVALGLELL